MQQRIGFTTYSVLLIGFALIAASPARAQNATTLDVQLGWNGCYRAGTWTPIYLTTTSPTPRQVIAEIYSPHAGPSAVRIWKSFVIGPTQATHVVYVPLTQIHQLRETTVMLRDARTDKRILEEAVPVHDPYSPTPTAQQPILADGMMIVVGISGRPSFGGTLPNELPARKVVTGYLKPALLPDVAAGYEALDLLVLNAPDLTAMGMEQQRAIADWVRAGGRLLLWPAEDPMPLSGPIVDLLPCRFGDNQSLVIDPAKVAAAGLQPRFGKHRARALLPLPGAEPVHLFDGTVTGYARSAGMGYVAVLPFDALSLDFDAEDRTTEFWKPVFETFITFPEKSENADNANYYRYGWQYDQRRNFGLYTTLDWLGDIPGAGAFGFGYVATVLLMLMAVVGPVDWFVLKRLGRQPWTWMTTTGWIGLVTLGAIYAGHVVKSGELHYRSVRLFDQADGTTVATTDLVGIYSPRTTTYTLDYNPEAWIQPAANAEYGRGSSGFSDMVFHQSITGTRPDGLRVNVWNLKFLESKVRTSSPAMLDAVLKRESTPNGVRVTGAIINRSDKAIHRVRIRTSEGVASLQGKEIAPGATELIDLPVNEKPDSLAVPPQGDNSQQYNYYSHSGTHTGTAATPDFKLMGLFEASRSDRLEAMLRKGSTSAVIYAELVSSAAPATLEAEGAIEKHIALIRALVTLEP